jgi:hypothetical protein
MILKSLRINGVNVIRYTLGQCVYGHQEFVEKVDNNGAYS